MSMKKIENKKYAEYTDDDLHTRLEGEKFDWSEEFQIMGLSTADEGILQMYIMHIAESFLYGSTTSFLTGLRDEAIETKIFIQNILISYIKYLKGVGWYSEEYMNEVCPETMSIFKTQLTPYELYKVIYHLEKHCRRYQQLCFGRNQEMQEHYSKDEYYKKRDDIYNNPDKYFGKGILPY